MLSLIVRIQAALLVAHHRWRQEHGQATAEYALVLLGIAAVALLVLAWATKTDKVGQLLNAVFDRLREHARS